MEYLSLIISFIAGGGLSTLLSVKMIRKNGQIDMTEKAIKFWEDQFNTISEKYTVLESKFEELKRLIEDRAPLMCLNAPDCEKRKIVKQ